MSIRSICSVQEYKRDDSSSTAGSTVADLQRDLSSSSVADDLALAASRVSAPNLAFYTNDPTLQKSQKLEFIKPSEAVFPGTDIITQDFSKYILEVGQPYFLWLVNSLEKNEEEANVEGKSSNQKAKPRSTKNGDGESSVLDECRKTVPALYFREEFLIEDPVTFSEVVIGSDESSYTGLEEKLWNHLDVIETQLVAKVLARLDPFLLAVKNLQDMWDEVAETKGRVSSLRTNLTKLEELMVSNALGVAHLKRQRGNMALVYAKLKRIATVRRTQPAVQSLLSSADYAGALDLIKRSQLVLESELSGVACFKNLLGELKENVSVIHKLMIAEFVQLAVEGAGLFREIVTSRGGSRVASDAGKSAEVANAGSMSGADGGSRGSAGLNDADAEAAASGVHKSNSCSTLPSITAPRVHQSPISHLTKSRSTMSVPDSARPLPLSLSRSASVAGASSWSAKSSAAPSEDDLQDRLALLVESLMLHACLPQALVAYRNRIASDSDRTIKNHLTACSTSAASTLSVPGVDLAALLDAEHGQSGGPSSEVGGAFPAPAAAANPVAVCLQEMDHEAFNALMETVYGSLMAILGRTVAATEFVRAVYSNSAAALDSLPAAVASPPPLTLSSSGLADGTAAAAAPCAAVADGDTSRDVLAASIGDVIQSAVEHMSTRSARLLTLRTQATARMGYLDFCALYETTKQYVVEAENLSKKDLVALRSALRSQAKTFFSSMHASKWSGLSMLVEHETWAPAEVPCDFQRIVDRLVAPPASGTDAADPVPTIPPFTLGSPPAARSGPSPPPELSPRADGAGASALTAAAGSSAGAGAGAGTADPVLSSHAHGNGTMDVSGSDVARKRATVAGQHFYVITSVLMLLQMIAEYLECIRRLPALTTDIVLRVADLLQTVTSLVRESLFNRDSPQDAISTVRKLALWSQAVAFLIALIPHLKISLGRFLQPKNRPLLSELERVQLDLVEHRKEVFSEMVNVMKERIEYYSKGLQIWPWDVEAPCVPSEPIKLLLKDMEAFHGAIVALVPRDQATLIWTRTLSMGLNRLADFFSRLDVATAVGRRRVHEDIGCCLSTIAKLSPSMVSDGVALLERIRLKKYPQGMLPSRT